MNAAIKHLPRTDLPAEILSEAIPEWAQIRDAAARLKADIIRRQQDFPATKDERLSTNDALLNAQGVTGIQSALDAARLAAAQREAAELDSANLMRARESAEFQLAQLERGATHEVTDVIRGRVENIAASIRALKARPLSAQAAIDADAADEWKALQQYARDWVALTKAYSALTKHAAEGPALTQLAGAAFIDDPLHNAPHFQARRAQAGKWADRPRPETFHAALIEWSRNAETPRFDTDAPKGAALPKDADPIAWVVYLVERDAVTVHEPGEAIELWQAATAATDEVTANSAESRALARVRYAQLIGDDALETVEDIRPLVEKSKRRNPRGSFFG